MTSQLRWRLVIGISAVALVFGLSVLKGMEWAFGQPLPWWVVIFWGGPPKKTHLAKKNVAVIFWAKSRRGHVS